MRTLQLPSDRLVTKANSPVLITQVAAEIKAVGAKIWLLQRFDYGSIIRAEIGQTQLRLVIPPISGDQYLVPKEPNSTLFIVRDLPSLKTWLCSMV